MCSRRFAVEAAQQKAPDDAGALILSEMLCSVPCDGRTTELPVQAGASDNTGVLERVVQGEQCGRAGERDGLSAHVVVQPFDLAREIVGEGIFEAATCSPSGTDRRSRRCVGDARGYRREGDSFFAVDQTRSAVDETTLRDDDAQATTHGAEPLEVLARRGSKSGRGRDRQAASQVERGRALDARPLDVSFTTPHDTAGLPIVADLATRQRARRLYRSVDADRATNSR